MQDPRARFVAVFRGLIVCACLIATCCAKASPTAPSTPGSVVLSQKTVVIESSVTVDLEDGVIMASLANEDIWYEAISSTESYLTPRNGSKVATYGSTSPGYAGCSAAPLAAARIPIPSLSAGVYLCARTRNLHYGQLRLDQVPTPGVLGPITVTYTIWR